MSDRMTQRDRVLQALRNRGGHGLTQVDFILPGVCDGGTPITRVAARIEELKGEGYTIATQPERRQRCVVYWLVSEPIPAQPAPVDAEADALRLFDLGEAA